jgi:hypothetical protein
LSLSVNGWGWLFALAVSVILSIFGIAIPNGLRQARKKRAHNTLKLLNEVLARHQLGYFTFYLALGFTGVMVAGFDRRFLAVPLALTILFYSVGVYRSTHVQDDFLKDDHKCPDDDTCDTDVPFFGPGLKLLWPNIVMAGILAWFAYRTLERIA